VLGIACVFKVSEIDVGDALIRILNYANADVAKLLVLSIQGVPDDVVAGLRMKGADAEHLVTAVARLPSAPAAAAAVSVRSHRHCQSRSRLKNLKIPHKKTSHCYH